jgi:hypothetical protein
MNITDKSGPTYFLPATVQLIWTLAAELDTLRLKISITPTSLIGTTTVSAAAFDFQARLASNRANDRPKKDVDELRNSRLCGHPVRPDWVQHVKYGYNAYIKGSLYSGYLLLSSAFFYGCADNGSVRSPWAARSLSAVVLLKPNGHPAFFAL